jgi:hypothetical protein
MCLQILIGKIHMSFNKILSLFFDAICLFGAGPEPTANDHIQSRQRLLRVGDRRQSQQITGQILVVIPTDVVRIGGRRSGMADGHRRDSSDQPALFLQHMSNGGHGLSRCIHIDGTIEGLDAGRHAAGRR